jgi:DNA-binding transcriptional LysR family regulator
LDPALQRLAKLTLRDVEIVRDLGRLNSLRELARRLAMEPSQISRIVARVEKALGFKVLERSVTGIVLTERGRQAVERFSEVCALLEETQANRTQEAPSIAVGGATFLNSRLVAPVTTTLASLAVTWRLLDVQPDDTVMMGLRGAFTVATHLGKMEWPRTWVSKKVGVVPWSVFARRGHPLTAKRGVDEKDLAAYPFIFPVYMSPSGLAYGNDHCPLPRDKRRAGTATASADAGLAVLRSSDQLGFLPEIVARDLVRFGEVVAIPVRGWASVARPYFLSARSESVSRKTFDLLAEGLAARLDAAAVSGAS